ncbi:MAG: DNA polymerase III subunit gamma/tau [Acidobacteriia bacterium]|nr:DNA polymerase III subunit gamma/tau [Terriglobia bacterium]
MSYQVIARKYRPQRFDDVIGQSVITTTLKNAIEQRRIGHAYLFSGVRGVGKTTTARILAKAFNCAKGPTPTPCEECDSCREIKNGNAVDVIEIDAASNRSIDDVRQLRENVKYRPSRDRYKIYIIDEAHQLTDDAWDALLKTLEEPPDHVIFIFATTERHKLKPTILSRCQNFSFRTLSYHEIYKSLETIAGAEKIAITPGALSMLGRAAEGSIRDGQSLLDQVISFCGSSVDESKIRELLGFVSQEYLDRLSEALVARDTQGVLRLVEDLIRAGFDPRHFCREAIQHIRNLMILRIGGKESELLELPPDEIERLAETASHFSEEDLVRFFHLLARTDSDLKWSTHPRLHLELGLVRLVQASRLMSIEEFLSDWKSRESSPGTAEGTEAGKRPQPPLAHAGAPPVKKNDERRAPPATPSTPDPSNRPSSRDSARSRPGPRSEVLLADPSSPVERGEEIFPEPGAGSPNESQEIESFRKAVFAKSKFLGSLLDHVTRVVLENSSLGLHFTPANKHIYSMLNNKEQIATLGQICQNVFRRQLLVKLVLTEGPDDEAPLPAKSEGAGPARRPISAAGSEEILKEPLVQSFVDTFRAEILQIKKK